MPEISRFFGIAIAIFYREQDTPHFDAYLGEHQVRVDIETGAIKGSFPPRALGLVLEWHQRHIEELRQNWLFAQGHRPLVAIAPLE